MVVWLIFCSQSAFRSLYSIPTTAEAYAFDMHFNTSTDVAYSNSDEYLFSSVRPWFRHCQLVVVTVQSCVGCSGGV